jgi:dihydrodipicolinate synthase/N-acetylneuraminate lyase
MGECDMLGSADLKGIMAMMPAFATDDAVNVDATATIDVDRLHKGVDRMIKDGGADVIATTGSFGETSNLLPSELATLARATVETVAKRVPVIIGCATLNTRLAVQQIRIAEEAGADGVIVGVPFYFPSTVDNAVQFYRDIAERFPKLGIMIYHNPVLHNVTLPVEAFKALSQIPNLIGMKDSHHTPSQFMELIDIVGDRISVFVNHSQYFSYAPIGASGFWAIDVWMGPEPMVFLKNAVARGDMKAARQATVDSSFNRAGSSVNLAWRENAHKIACRFAGYVDPGPLRPPFTHIPEDVVNRQKARAKRWRELCAKYAAVSAATAAE